LTFDKWIPSTLFLTHYFPDDPQQWQEVDVASLILGQNGIWGDLLGVSDPGIAFIGSTLARYKQVRDDITESDPVVTGIVSGSPEIHEKISATTGRGAVVIFATERGTYQYITSHQVAAEHWISDGVTVARDTAGRAKQRSTSRERKYFSLASIRHAALEVRRHRCGLHNAGCPTFAPAYVGRKNGRSPTIVFYVVLALATLRVSAVAPL
jgi:hypothetical protein